MKHILFSALAFASAVALADVGTGNTFGLLPVNSATKRTIVSVPWCEISSSDDASVRITNIVKTANLSLDDQLYCISGSDGTFNSWKLAESAGVKYWQSVQEVKVLAETNAVQEIKPSPAADLATAGRGGCFVLIRQSYTNENGTAKPFYLYGQLGTSSSLTNQLAQGTKESPAWSFLSSPTPDAWYVNGDNITWTGVSTNDNLYVEQISASGSEIGIRLMLVWDSEKGKWGTKKSSGFPPKQKFNEFTSAVAPGTGVWYLSREGNAKVVWSGVPSK